MSLYTKALQSIAAQFQFKLDALNRNAPIFERLDQLVERLTSQGLSAKASININTAKPELIIHGDEAALRNAITGTGHVIGRSEVAGTWIIVPPSDAREFSITFIAWVNVDPRETSLGRHIGQTTQAAPQ